MITAGISSAVRRAVYKREGYACAICSGSTALQVHHYIPRGHGGNDSVHNLVCLCSICHADVHGLNPDTLFTPQDMEQAICEYLADYYAPIYPTETGWDPYI
jgi:hypothetical protein